TLNTYPDSATLNKVVNPQTLLAYTAGIKTQTSNHMLTGNLEAFYYNYKDLIIQAFNSALGEETLYNAPKATVDGLQFSSTFRPTGQDSLAANVAYTEGKYG